MQNYTVLQTQLAHSAYDMSKMHQEIMAITMSDFLCIMTWARRTKTEYERVISQAMDETKNICGWLI